MYLRAALLWLQASFRSWGFATMAFIFMITTPAGVAIGIGIQSTYNANSLNALVTQGIFDSVSTGECVLVNLAQPTLQAEWPHVLLQMLPMWRQVCLSGTL